MNLESQWTDKKKRNRNIIIGLVILIIVIWGYYNCKWEGPEAWIDFNWGPGYCTTGLSAETAGGGTCGTCTNGGSCECTEITCENCRPPADRDPCGRENDYTCGGYCPNGYECRIMTYADMEGVSSEISQVCSCVPEDPIEREVEDSCYWGGTISLTCSGMCSERVPCSVFEDLSGRTVCGCPDDNTYMVI